MWHATPKKTFFQAAWYIQKATAQAVPPGAIPGPQDDG